MGTFSNYWARFINYASTPEGKKKVLLWGGGAVIGLIVVIIIIVVASTSGSGHYEKGSDALGYYPLIDGHNDLAMNIRAILKNNITKFNFKDLSKTPGWSQEKCVYGCQTNLTNLRSGKVGGVFWSAYVECNHTDAVAETLEQIDVIKRFIDQNKRDMTLVTQAGAIHSAFNSGKIAGMIGVEGGHSIDSRLGVLRMLYDLGVRYMTLTHTCNLPWADAANNSGIGLTNFGEDVVHEMNRLGMIVDLSHVSDGVMDKVLNISKAPVIFSHSSARALCNHPRNVPDDILKKLKINGGVIMINFNPGFLCSGTIGTGTNNVTQLQVMKHINHVVDLIGHEHVGIGSDFDGIEKGPINLENTSKFPFLFDSLRSSNSTRWSIDNLEKLAGRNLVRVWNTVELVRDQLRNEVPHQEWISQEFVKNDKCRTKSDVKENVTESLIVEVTTTPATTPVPTTITTTTTVVPTTPLTVKSGPPTTTPTVKNTVIVTVKP